MRSTLALVLSTLALATSAFTLLSPPAVEQTRPRTVSTPEPASPPVGLSPVFGPGLLIPDEGARQPEPLVPRIWSPRVR